MTDDSHGDLAAYGWDPFFSNNFDELNIPDAFPCRVVSEFRSSYQVISEYGELTAVITGKMRYEADPVYGHPAVGDWAAAVRADDEQCVIHAVLPRKSWFSRKAAGPKMNEQVAAANIDVVFIVTALEGRDFNLRRIERYLTLAWKSGASPVIVLNKVDLCPEPDTFIGSVESIAPGVPVFAVSATANIGLDDIRDRITSGSTAALLGSSGVGKSAIINALLGTEKLATNAIRESDLRGRHTTTHRELIPIPDGGMVIDTPGMRELQMWGNETDLQDSFEDIEALVLSCRFADCAHESEPGCAVREALDSGELDPSRYRNYRDLQKELRYIARKEDYTLQQQDELRWKQISKLGKKLKKHKYKGR